jgi:phage gp36-like protein
MAAPEYATVAQMQAMIDDRLLEQLTSDTGADATVDGSNVPLMTAIQRASSDVESYAMRGGRYSRADLEALLTAEDTTLIGLVADLVLFHLISRRGGDLPTAVLERVQFARNQLKALAKGEWIFGKDDDSPDAGQPKISVIDLGQRLNLDMVSDSPFFPSRRTRTY